MKRYTIVGRQIGGSDELVFAECDSNSDGVVEAKLAGRGRGGRTILFYDGAK